MSQVFDRAQQTALIGLDRQFAALSFWAEEENRWRLRAGLRAASKKLAHLDFPRNSDSFVGGRASERAS